ncbi:hypothetical protein [Streptomyces sp. NRRL S-920]|uniref:hypothetical protein n=1 Tax=Streptomyces sp. NRRL S-920 TaxID=1463921 RepID=UPI0007C535F7|nr:hypothetical protein [Streptomyces sp. NRRL S-920]
MMHGTEDIEQERCRVARRPAAQDAPPVLCWFDVAPTGPADAYAARLRNVLDAALGLALSEDFDGPTCPSAPSPSGSPP